MLLGHLSMSLHPRPVPLRLDALLSAWLRADLQPAACRAAVEDLLRGLGQDAGQYLAPEEIERGGLVATPELLFGAHGADRPWHWLAANRSTGRSFELEVTSDALATVGALVRAGTQAASRAAFEEAAAELSDPELAEVLADGPTPPSHGRWPASAGAGAGIWRREHACLLVRSETTTLVLDPQGFHHSWTTNGARYPDEPALPRADAILVTHSHNDHWHLPSVLRWAADPEVPVLVPQVRRPNLLTPESMAGSLEKVGQRALAPAWGETVVVGDIEIDVLPFYGEQPTREAPGPDPALRSWGNCYRFTTPDFSALVLVDSGIDPAGSMLDVLGASRARRGPPDVLLSVCHAFPELVNRGLPEYALTLPFSEVVRRYRQGRQSMTLGPEGLARAFTVSGARWFLPYAHGFGGLGRDPVSAESSRTRESQAVDALERDNRTPTRIVRWMCGDRAVFPRGGELTVEPAGG